MSWTAVMARPDGGRREELAAEAARLMAARKLSIREAQDRRALMDMAVEAVREASRRTGIPIPDPEAMLAIARQVAARVGGLGFLEGLLPPACRDYSDIVLNPDGSVWARRKGSPSFERLEIAPSREEAWRAVEAILAPLGKALTEATPTVDGRIQRDPAIGFGGARVKAIHPVVAAGDGYPALILRLFEPAPVPPERILEWGVAPRPVLDRLLQAVADRLRVLIIGGTYMGKTTLLSALCHGIPKEARIVKIEDPEEIWLPHPNVVTLEARPAPPGSDVKPYTVRDGVDDAMRMGPDWLIVGEVRTGDAALSLFRAQMSDHPGLSTFHADSPEAAVFRMGVIMFADAGVRFEAAKAMFAEAVDLVVQVGRREGRRQIVGVWEVDGLKSGDVRFRLLYEPGREALEEIRRRRS